MNAIGSSQPSAAVIATPNTAYSRFKGAFSLCCAGPSMSTDGVMDKNPHEEGNEDKKTENTPEKSLPKKKKAKTVGTERQQRQRQPMKLRSNSLSLSAPGAVRSGMYHA